MKLPNPTKFNPFMKLQLSQTHDSTRKKVVYEDGDRNGISSWLKDVRAMQIDYHFLTLEPPSLPIVAVARAFATHIRDIGIITSYKPDAEFGSPDLNCKMSLNLEYGGTDFNISLDFGCKLRPDLDAYERASLTKQMIADWLFDRIVNNLDSSPITGMKLKAYYTIQLESCLINGLELEI